MACQGQSNWQQKLLICSWRQSAKRRLHLEVKYNLDPDQMKKWKMLTLAGASPPYNQGTKKVSCFFHHFLICLVEFSVLSQLIILVLYGEKYIIPLFYYAANSLSWLCHFIWSRRTLIGVGRVIINILGQTLFVHSWNILSGKPLTQIIHLLCSSTGMNYKNNSSSWTNKETWVKKEYDWINWHNETQWEIFSNMGSLEETVP